MKLTTISKNHIFILGDNRDINSDNHKSEAVTKIDISSNAMSILYAKNNRSGIEIE